MEPTPVTHGSYLAESNHLRNRASQPFPVGGLALQRPAARARERIKLGTPAVFGYLPFRFDPSFLFQLVKCRVKGPIAHLEYVSRNLFQPLADCPSVQRFQGDNLKKEKVQSALDEIGWFAHGFTIGYRGQNIASA